MVIYAVRLLATVVTDERPQGVMSGLLTTEYGLVSVGVHIRPSQRPSTLTADQNRDPKRYPRSGPPY